MGETETLPVGSVIGTSHTAGEPSSGLSGQPTCSKLTLDDSQRTVMITDGRSTPWTVAESMTVEAAPSFTRMGDSRGESRHRETIAPVGDSVGTELRSSASADGVRVGYSVGEGVGPNVGLQQHERINRFRETDAAIDGLPFVSTDEAMAATPRYDE